MGIKVSMVVQGDSNADLADGLEALARWVRSGNTRTLPDDAFRNPRFSFSVEEVTHWQAVDSFPCECGRTLRARRGELPTGCGTDCLWRNGVSDWPTMGTGG